MKPELKRDINQSLPKTLRELKTGVYYVKAQHMMTYQLSNYNVPNGALYELECPGRGQGTLWYKGYVLEKIKRTDSGVICMSLDKDEYNRYLNEN